MDDYALQWPYLEDLGCLGTASPQSSDSLIFVNSTGCLLQKGVFFNFV